MKNKSFYSGLMMMALSLSLCVSTFATEYATGDPFGMMIGDGSYGSESNNNRIGSNGTNGHGQGSDSDKQGSVTESDVVKSGSDGTGNHDAGSVNPRSDGSVVENVSGTMPTGDSENTVMMNRDSADMIPGTENDGMSNVGSQDSTNGVEWHDSYSDMNRSFESVDMSNVGSQDNANGVEWHDSGSDMNHTGESAGASNVGTDNTEMFDALNNGNSDSVHDEVGAGGSESMAVDGEALSGAEIENSYALFYPDETRYSDYEYGDTQISYYPVWHDGEMINAEIPDTVLHSFEFAFDLFRKKALSVDGNMLISPSSLLDALCLMCSGVGDDELDAKALIGNTLFGTGDGYKNSLDADLAFLDTMGINKSSVFEEMNANIRTDNIQRILGLWVDGEKGYQFQDSFVSYLRSNFSNVMLNVQAVPFTQDTADDVNQWFSDVTGGSMKELISGFNDGELLKIATALHFKDAWDNEFSKSNELETFHNADGSVSEVSMLKDYGGPDCYYVDGLDFYGFSKTYMHTKCVFMAIIPKDEGMTARDLLSTLSVKDLVGAYRNCIRADFQIAIPEFDEEIDIDFKKELNETALAPFMTTSVPLTGMFGSDGSDGLMIQDLGQKIFFNIDEHGTEAGVVTRMGFGSGSARIPEARDVIIDRPFLYCILDWDSGYPLFIGIVNNLK